MQNLMQNLECLVGSVLILSTKQSSQEIVSATRSLLTAIEIILSIAEKLQVFDYRAMN